MNCAKVLHALGGHSQQAVAPVDFAMSLCLSRAPPLYQLLGMQPHRSPSPARASLRSLHGCSSSSSTLQPHRSPSLARSSLHSLPGCSLPVPALRSCFRRAAGPLPRKRVVFADAVGLALTAVRLFVPDPPSSPATAVVVNSLDSSICFGHSNHFNPSQARLQVPSANYALVKLQHLQASPLQAKLQNIQTSPSLVRPQNIQTSPLLVRPQNIQASPSLVRPQNIQTSPLLVRPQNIQTSPSLVRPQNIQTSPSLVRRLGLIPSSAGVQPLKLWLGFPQPTVDLKGFASRLQEALVQLESCSVTEGSLSGTVRVCNVGNAEKTVHLRVTLDSWRSHRDVPCALCPQLYGASDTDVFVFDVALPLSLDPKERLEFCVLFRPGPGAALRCDNNRGHNYRVLVEPGGSAVNQGSVARRSSAQQDPQKRSSWPRNPLLSSRILSSSPTLSSPTLSSPTLSSPTLSSPLLSASL